MSPARTTRRPALTAIAALALGGLLGGPAAADPADHPPGYRVHGETLLILDRWRGTRAVTVERTDMRQRLRLDAWRLGQDPDTRGGPRLDLALDLEIGSDLGPTADVLDAVPDGRRVILDLYAAHLDLRGAFDVLDVRLGRQRTLDALGFEGFDGAAVEVRALPYVTLRAHGGLTIHRAWSTFGPELYETDDTRLRDAPGGVVGVGARTRGLDAVAADVVWRRVLDDGGTLQDAVAAAALARLGDAFDASAGAVYDLLYLRPSELRAGLGWRASAATRLDAEWLRSHPTFAGDSIWSAFVTEAHHAARLAAHHQTGPWRISGDAELRLFDGGAGGAAEDDRAFVGGARVQRAFRVLSRAAHAGLDGRLGLGYGGARHHLDAFGRLPIRLMGPESPLWLRMRLGAMYFDVPDRDDWDGWAGWLAVAGEWYAADGLRLDGVLEGHTHRAEALRVRAMARLTVEGLW